MEIFLFLSLRLLQLAVTHRAGIISFLHKFCTTKAQNLHSIHAKMKEMVPESTSRHVTWLDPCPVLLGTVNQTQLCFGTIFEISTGHRKSRISPNPNFFSQIHSRKQAHSFRRIKKLGVRCTLNKCYPFILFSYLIETFIFNKSNLSSFIKFTRAFFPLRCINHHWDNADHGELWRV